ncbi:copper transporter [Helicobacter turcicus]|uniref:Copper transporter n=1 Tax=Helicobacter turcicus TaxID=2867412 RepID=A0ABS7JNZ9_9HELI|nr:copper transporter [Helicobacter turcicus]MBX7491140.1 copper transporter [Helicobacter turcicus]MBX7546006.1 copper transporter [Helicobacter turcicus]
MKCFKSDCIIFYTLFLSDKEMQDQANSENLRDFLEAKICVVLNLPKEHEYFLHYTLSDSGTAYHCVLLDKETLKDYTSSAEEFLSHPCFLCAQFVREGYVLIKDGNLNWVFVGFKEQNIVDFYALENLGEVRKKLETLGLNAFWLWEVGDLTCHEREILKDMESKFSRHHIAQTLENMELLESYNFNPLEKSLPFLQTRTGGAFKCLVAGVALGIALGAVFILVGLLKQRENTGLQLQISTLQSELERLSENRTQAQNELIGLQEKLESLWSVYHSNAESLKDFGEADFQVAQLILTLNPHLEKFNVKIAYFGVEQESFALLLFGVNALKVLEAVEKESLGEIQTMGAYGEFVWSAIKGNKNGNS